MLRIWYLWYYELKNLKIDIYDGKLVISNEQFNSGKICEISENYISVLDSLGELYNITDANINYLKICLILLLITIK